MTARMHFIGVTTGQSSIIQLFPRWAEVLGLEAQIAGRDLPIGAQPDAYREVVDEIRSDDAVRGALVTTHKVAIYEHAKDLFRGLDRWAEACGEVSCISKVDGELVGHAKDPITSGLSMEDMLGSTYWHDHPEAEVLCMGAGGSGTAITVRLLSEGRSPARILVTNRSTEPLDRLRRVHQQLGAGDRVEYHAVSGPEESDALLASLSPKSLVINATGMGKDRPGSPITDRGLFPEQGVVWELNYRGVLRFLGQARRQEGRRQLSIHDGWRYFLHGWAEHVAEVFGLEMTPELFGRLAAAAEPFRGGRRARQ
ncbi:MAG: shikimate dehydrogenase family protein [Acidimicrobiia bacterium]